MGNDKNLTNEKENLTVNENGILMIPYIVYENSTTRSEERFDKMHNKDINIIKWLIATIVFLIVLAVGSFMYVFTQYDFASYEQVISGENIGGDQTIEDGIHIGQEVE